MAVKKRIWLIMLLLFLILAVKLIWFEPPLTYESALNTAHWQLEIASNEFRFDLGRFGHPDVIGGKGDRDGYLFTWRFTSVTGQQLDVLVGVSQLDVDFTGFPFLLDCRPGRDSEIRQAGFGYLCVSQ